MLTTYWFLPSIFSHKLISDKVLSILSGVSKDTDFSEAIQPARFPSTRSIAPLGLLIKGFCLVLPDLR